MRLLSCFAFLLLFALSHVAFPAHAEEGNGAFLVPDKSIEALNSTPQILLKEREREKKQDIWDKVAELPLEIQEQLLDETAQAEIQCQRTPKYVDYFDCSCFALQFLKERYEKGPDRLIFANAFFNMDLTPCVFKPVVAGNSYKRCFLFVDKKLSPEYQEEICQCAARTTADEFARRPRPDIRYVTNITTSYMNRCQRDILGRF